jgi:hypothetical protein
VTLILGLKCKEGVLLISDGQTTVTPSGAQAYHAIRTSSEKAHAHWTNVAWGAAGNTNLIYEIGSNLKEAFAPSHFAGRNRSDTKKEITKKVMELNAQIYQRSGAFYANNALQALGTTHMFVGYCQDGPFILVVYGDHIYRDFVDTGYAAIGSGEIFPHFALAGLEHFEVKERTLFEAKVIAYRVVDSAIRIAAFGLGYPIQIVEISEPPSGQEATAKKLSPDEIAILEEKVAEWKATERETLENLVGVSTAPEAETETASAAPPESSSSKEPTKGPT